MTISNDKSEPRMDAQEIQAGVAKRLEKYKKLNDLEQFAMFMGTAQILEAGLKNLLICRFGYDKDEMEKWTLGKTAAELEKSGLRKDFVVLLKSVVNYRNHIAHELLANQAMLRAILGRDAGGLERGPLDKGIYEVEQLLFLHDWCEEHNAWM